MVQEKEPPERKRKPQNFAVLLFGGSGRRGGASWGHGRRRGRPQQVCGRRCRLAGGAGRAGRPHPETTCAGRKDENGSHRRRPGALGLPRNLARTSPLAPCVPRVPNVPQAMVVGCLQGSRV